MISRKKLRLFVILSAFILVSATATAAPIVNEYLTERNSQMILLSVIPLVRFDAYPYHHINDVLRDYAESRKTYFINPLKAFSEYRSANLWVSMADGHYNAKENQAIAGLVKDLLIDSGFLKSISHD